MLADMHVLMAIQDFTDSAGVTWRVWATTPRESAIYEESLRRGWLTFDSKAGRRRLAPIPRGWEKATPHRLELMCRAAEVVRRTSRPVTPPDPFEPPTGGGEGDERPPPGDA